MIYYYQSVTMKKETSNEQVFQALRCMVFCIVIALSNSYLRLDYYCLGACVDNDDAMCHCCGVHDCPYNDYHEWHCCRYYWYGY